MSEPTNTPRYPDLPSSLTHLEEAVIEIWREEDPFRQNLAATEGAEEFVFYEGPPTANGRPGIHHIISRTIKDLVCRYQSMQGKHVTRIAGWDTHGLPVEIEAQRQHGINDKKEIEERGIAWFNEQCKNSVFTYKEEWEQLSERIGYWLDYTKPYVTFHTDYVESVWAILKRLSEKDLLYRGHKVVPWCPKDQTVLSSHELSLGYKDVEDPSCYVTMELKDGSGRHLLVWTTTPWTLVSNVACAVNPDLTYVEVEHEGKTLVVGKGRAGALFDEDQIGGEVDAASLVGVSYQRPFELIPESEAKGRAWEIIAAPYVSDEDGSGIVHLAPAYGAEDYVLGRELGLAILAPIQENGGFPDDMPLVGGMGFKEADDRLAEDLKSRGILFRYGKLTHSYPHCWRCDSPLVYMARTSWFAATSTLGQELLDNNEKIAWHPPEVGEGRFGEWLKGNVDWALSRDRYWGTPLPAWVSDDDPDHVEWIGSVAELAEKAGGLPENFDPHRPFIDEITWQDPETGSTMRRTPEVIDVWFDSGAMPWAQWHYPFENEEAFKRHYPADFICEGVDQTRGWFYSLHAISTMLGMGPAYKNVIVNDLILDAEGRKMSKSKGNVVNPWEAIEEFGADGIRWYMITVSNPWLPKRFDPSGLREASAKFFDTLFNTYKFFSLYANVEDWTPSDQDPVLEARPVIDRWLASRLNTLIKRVREELDAYHPTRAYRLVGEFLDEDLSNWYVRRSRPRFWGNGDTDDARAAFRSLYDALKVVSSLVAPVTPFTSDWVYRGLTGESSHLAGFPEFDESAIDTDLETQMDQIRAMRTLGRAAREAVKIRVRQPLNRILAVVPGDGEPSAEVLSLLKDELNVKNVEFLGSAEGLVKLVGKPNFRALGPRFQKNSEGAAQAIREMSQDQLQRFEAGETVAIDVAGVSANLEKGDLEVVEEADGDLVVRSDGAGYVVALDPTLTEELRSEGLARELINRIQRLRKDSGLEITDRIVLGVFGEDAVVAAAGAHQGTIAGETLATSLTSDGEKNGYDVHLEVDLDGHEAVIALSKAPA